MLRILTVVSDGVYPKVSQQSVCANYPQDVMVVAGDLKFALENLQTAFQKNTKQTRTIPVFEKDEDYKNWLLEELQKLK
jgi:hypothetical protein